MPSIKLSKPFAAIVLLCAVTSLHAQQAAAPSLPSYAVISIKPNNSGSTSSTIRRLPDGIHMENVSIGDLVRFAYNLNFDGQMINLPAWAAEADFDIDVRVDTADIEKFKALTVREEKQSMQAVLISRFKLLAHHEDRQMPVYNLVVAKGGPKPALKAVDSAANGFVNSNANHITMHDEPIAALAETLTRRTNRTVIDKTGLTGNYDVELKFTPDSYDPAMAKTDKEAAEAAARAGNDGEAPTLFTAIQEQLGLKLVSAKGPVDCIVIDHIEKPAAN